MPRAGLPDAVFAAARNGEPRAIAALLAVAQPDIRRYARSACRTSADAEDAAQEALWLLFRRVGTIRSLGAFSAWLFVVVRRECIRIGRRAGLHLERPIEDDELERRFGSRPEAELRLDLAAALEALPDGYREVVLLRDVREMTIDEIASALGATRASIKARLHRARLLLREFLER